MTTLSTNKVLQELTRMPHLLDEDVQHAPLDVILRCVPYALREYTEPTDNIEEIIDFAELSRLVAEQIIDI